MSMKASAAIFLVSIRNIYLKLVLFVYESKDLRNWKLLDSLVEGYLVILTSGVEKAYEAVFDFLQVQFFDS